MRERFEDKEGKRRLVEVFASQELALQDRDLARSLADIAEVNECEEKRELYAEGDPGKNCLYFIISGAFDLLGNGDYVRTVRAGQAVGEFPILNPSVNYSATIRARERSVVALVSEGRFLSVANEHPEIWKNMAKMLAKRSRACWVMNHRPARAADRMSAMVTSPYYNPKPALS